jgi:hypothetical protein
MPTTPGSGRRCWRRGRARPTGAGGLELVEHLVAGDELDPFLATSGDDDRRAVIADRRRGLLDRRLAPSTVNLAPAAATSLREWLADRAGHTAPLARQGSVLIIRCRGC